MMIDRIIIENFKSFKWKTPIAKFNKINVFIGQNGSGKTNVVLALYLIKGLQGKEYPPAFIKNGVFDHEYDKQISIELELIPSYEERNEILNKFTTISPQLNRLTHNNKFLCRINYAIKLQDGGIVEERISISIKSENVEPVLVRKIIDGKPKQSCLQLAKILSEVHSVENLNDMQLVNDGEWIPTILGSDAWNYVPHILGLESLTEKNDRFEHDIATEIIHFLQKFHWYLADRTIPNVLSNEEQNFIYGDGHNIKDHIRYLCNKERANFDKLKEIANDYLGISDIVIDTANNDVKVRRKDLSTLFDLSELSAGEKQLLILLDAIVMQRPDNIYFIEEPEVHVHSKTQKKFLKELIKRSENSQFFITTHSPNFFKLDEPVSNYSVTKIEGQTKIELIENKDQIQSVKLEMGIDNLDALQSNFVLFVEGKSEVDALRTMGLVPQYSALKYIPIIPYNGKGNAEGLSRFLGYIDKNNLDLTPIAITDGHPEMKRVKLKYKIPRTENKEFEDQFDDKVIVNAMKTVYDDCNFEKLEELLRTGREEKGVVEILKSYLGILCGREFKKKTELAVELAKVTVTEIESRNLTKGKQMFEKELDQVMERLQS